MSDLPPDLKDQICIAAYYLAEKKYPYDTLCWLLAERQLYVENANQNAPIDHIRQRAAQLFHSCCDYDILCWLIAEKDMKIGYNEFREDTSPYFSD